MSKPKLSAPGRFQVFFFIGIAIGCLLVGNFPAAFLELLLAWSSYREDIHLQELDMLKGQVIDLKHDKEDILRGSIRNAANYRVPGAKYFD